VAEEARLAYTIHLIDQDTSVVPKGAFVLGSSSHVMINSAFRGLEEHESRKLTSFLHLRAPNKLQDLSATDKSALTASLDFLDNLGMDEPKGVCVLNKQPCLKRVQVVGLLGSTVRTAWRLSARYCGLGTHSTMLSERTTLERFIAAPGR